MTLTLQHLGFTLVYVLSRPATDGPSARKGGRATDLSGTRRCPALAPREPRW